MFSLLRVSSFLCRLIFKSDRLDAVMSGVICMFLEKSLWSGFWTTLFGPCPDHPVINLTAFSTLGMTSLYIAAKIASMTRVFTEATTLSTFFKSCRLFSFTDLILTCNVILKRFILQIVIKTIVRGPSTPSSAAPTWAILPLTKSFQGSFNWLKSCSDVSSGVWKPYLYQQLNCPTIIKSAVQERIHNYSETVGWKWFTSYVRSNNFA